MQTRKSFLATIMSLGAGIVAFPKLSNLFSNRSTVVHTTKVARKAEKASNIVPRKSV